LKNHASPQSTRTTTWDENLDLTIKDPAGKLVDVDDEHFNYNTSPIPLQGRWFIHGLFLPEDILEKVYYRNAERILRPKNLVAGT
jgi:hypothetical protein